MNGADLADTGRERGIRERLWRCHRDRTQQAVEAGRSLPRPSVRKSNAVFRPIPKRRLHVGQIEERAIRGRTDILRKGHRGREAMGLACSPAPWVDWQGKTVDSPSTSVPQDQFNVAWIIGRGESRIGDGERHRQRSPLAYFGR